ncbi:MAG: hypothetical protein EOM72_01855 [Opitutae bacterium]|nr:hypothetical protein [Opitutae bacterium]
MNRREVSKITCVADVRLTARLEAEADRMGLRETYSERGKQVALKARPAWQPFGLRSAMAEAPSDLLRLYVPRAHERAAMIRLASAADLFLPGRGSIFAEDAVLVGDAPPPWDEAKLCADPPAWAADGRLEPAAYDLVFCIVQRGRGGELARAMLEMGLGVPIVSYGEGMGMRDRLGLLRIAIPQEKEILWFLVPPGDSDLVVDVSLRKAGLREPGRGFLGRIPVRALAVNSRMHLDRRRHVATMEQVISTLDQLRGSTDWRRITAAARRRNAPEPRAGDGMARFTLICEEGSAAAAVRAALDAGAGGATLSRLSRRAPDPHEGDEEVAMASHARECCDLVVPRSLVARLEDAAIRSGLFEPPANGFIEIGPVHDAVTYIGR